MKRAFYASLLLNILTIGLVAYIYIRSTTRNIYLDYHYTKYNYWKEKKSLYDSLEIDSTDIVFVGNSLIDGGEWIDLTGDHRIKNRGIGGDNSEGLLQRIMPIARGNPRAIFIDEGINDIAYKTTTEKYISNMEMVIMNIQVHSPSTKIYIMSLLPTNTFHNDSVVVWNKLLMDLCAKKNVAFLNYHDQFTDASGGLKKEYTLDGLHLTGKGYLLWASLLKTYLNSLPHSLPK